VGTIQPNRTEKTQRYSALNSARLCG